MDADARGEIVMTDICPPPGYLPPGKQPLLLLFITPEGSTLQTSGCLRVVVGLGFVRNFTAHQVTRALLSLNVSGEHLYSDGVSVRGARPATERFYPYDWRPLAVCCRSWTWWCNDATALAGYAFSVAASTFGNTLPNDIQSAPSLSSFHGQLKTFLFHQSFPDIIL